MIAWQAPSDASAYCTGFAAALAPPTEAGSSTLKLCAPVLISTSVTPTSVPCAANTTCPFAASLARTSRVLAMSVASDMGPPGVRRS